MIRCEAEGCREEVRPEGRPEGRPGLLVLVTGGGTRVHLLCERCTRTLAGERPVHLVRGCLEGRPAVLRVLRWEDVGLA